MEAWVFIVGMLIFGLCVLGAAFVISAAIAGSTKSGAGSATLQQPALTFFTEYDASDYLGVSLKELDYMRESGMLDGTFMSVTSLEKTGEEEYAEIVDGVEVRKIRPIMSNITRYLFNKSLLDEKMLEIIKAGRELDTSERLSRAKDRRNNNKQRDNRPNSGRNNGEKREKSDNRDSREKKSGSGEHRQNSQNSRDRGPKKPRSDSGSSERSHSVNAPESVSRLAALAGEDEDDAE